ncbi:glycosyltransferase family 4 protein [Streptacidiphilus sp. PB12-B1b]|uniref:glycosyltransferase family 4 protein n=1 Tax=Streptacidiphilus sp. PB12-B1b TaxID=2705012 RepID=UPI0015FDC5AD|nr:glycosyltransferase family 4 protein [Streptacidiphilus sp. PB12-B1b]QMU74761.1 glycosyltransferase family 4 protein [Streptacidiphilus sp. PB12-B1b]
MTAKHVNILTGINRPAAPSSGSAILVNDLYGAIPEFHTTFLGRAPVDQTWTHSFDQLITLTTVKRPHGPHYDAYVDALTDEVAALIDKIRPAAIHAQYLGFALSLALTRAAGTIPVTAIAHGPDVIVAERSRWENETLNEVAAASAVIIVPTHALADRIDRLTGRRLTDRLNVIPWGIPLGDVQVCDHPPTRTGPLSLVHAGRLDENKATITGVEALALTDQPHHLTVIGNGILRQHLERRAAELGLSDRVHFIPFLPRAELWRRLPEFDAFVFTTRGLEAFGLVAVEAQAHRLPVVYSDLPGAREILGIGGVPYIPGDPHSLAAALDDLGRDVHRHDTLAKAAFDNARRYDIATTGRRLRELTLRGNSPGSPPRWHTLLLNRTAARRPQTPNRRP